MFVYDYCIQYSSSIKFNQLLCSSVMPLIFILCVHDWFSMLIDELQEHRKHIHIEYVTTLKHCHMITFCLLIQFIQSRTVEVYSSLTIQLFNYTYIFIYKEEFQIICIYKYIYKYCLIYSRSCGCRIWLQKIQKAKPKIWHGHVII